MSIFLYCSDANGSDIDLNAEYSDSDNEIPLEEKKFWEYLTKLEENNLFEMNLFQDRTQTLEKMEKEAAERIAAKRSKVVELNNNIKLLADSMQGRQDRLTYYSSMLDNSHKQPTQKSASSLRGSSKPKSSAADKRQSAATLEQENNASKSAGAFGATTRAGTFGGRRGLQ